MKFKHILSIETSCDDTSIAIVRHDGYVVRCIAANQDIKHKVFGGIVPEIAGRAHTEMIIPLIDDCLKQSNWDWSQIDGIAVTNRPGLVGSLLVGVVTAKALALAKGISFIGVNHLEAHLLAPFLYDEKHPKADMLSYPYMALAISGGHTHLYLVKSLGVYQILGATLDDAAGEAFDKFAKMMGLGFPGGVKVDQFAKLGNPKAFQFPRSLMREKNLNFSFSGLKSAAQRQLQTMTTAERKENVKDLCASYQQAIVDVLIHKLHRACEQYGINKAVLTGGVSANSRLRQDAFEWAQGNKIDLVVPPIRYCTDNAAMVGLVGIQRLNSGESSDYSLGPSPRVHKSDFIYE